MKNLLLKSLSLVFCFCLFVGPIYAQEVSFSLDPSSDVVTDVGDGLGIDVILDMGGQSVNSIEFDIGYSGDIEYVTYVAGSHECDTLMVEPPFFLCGDIEPGGGPILVTLYFKAIADGTASVSLDFIEYTLSGETEGVIYSDEVSGSYTTSVSSETPVATNDNEDGEKLPETFVASWVYAVVLGCLVLGFSFLLKFLRVSPGFFMKDKIR